MEALEAHLREHPNDGGSWLVYADWLTERGDPRGEVIVLEHRLSAELPEAERRAARTRLGELYGLHRDDWLRGLPGRVGTRRWRFGFLVAVTLHGVESGKRLSELLEHPTCRFLTELTLWGLRADLGLAGSPALQELRTLKVQGPFGDEGAEALARSTLLPRLTALRLGNCGIGSRGAMALARSEALAGLTALDLGNAIHFHLKNELGPEAVNVVIRSPALARLDTLNLEGLPLDGQGIAALTHETRPKRLVGLGLRRTQLGPGEVAALAHSEALSGLARLDLSANPLGDRGAAALASSPALRGLTVLTLDRTQIGPQGASELARSETLTGLVALDLGYNDLSAEGAIALAGATWTHLAALSLTQTRIGPDGAAALARSESLRRLLHLDLSGARIGEEGVVALVQSPVLDELRLLNLGNRSEITDETGLDHIAGFPGRFTLFDSPSRAGHFSHEAPIGCGGAEMLAASPRLTRLVALGLHAADIGDKGAIALATSPHLSRLTHLNLRENGIENAGADALARSTTLPELTFLDLTYNGIKIQGARALARSTALCSLRWLGLDSNHGLGPKGAEKVREALLPGRALWLMMEGSR